MNKFLLPVASFLFLLTAARAQVPYFQNYYLSKKSEPVHVNVIFQDKAGFIWYGTNKGLMKFDGTAYTRFGLRDSLADENITAIAEDSTHRIWIGHKSGGISILDNNVITRFSPREGLPTQQVSAILFDRMGNLWFSTLGDGLYYFVRDRLFRLDDTDGMPDLFVYDIMQDRQGAIWAGTDGGVAICTLTGTKASTKVISYGHGLPDNIVKKLALDEDGLVWMVTEDSGIILFDPVTRRYAPMISDGWRYGTITDFLFSGNQVWISTNNGLVVFSRRTAQVRQYNSRTVPGLVALNTLLKDAEGNIWVGTKTGVFRALGDYVRHIETFDPHTDLNVVALTIDHQGDIWFANSEGLFRQTSQASGLVSVSRQLLHSPFQKYTVISLLTDTAGYIWAGLYGEGVLRINPRTGGIRYLNKELRNGNVLNISGKGGNIWLATLGGATHITVAGDELSIRNYSSSEGLASDYVYQAFIDSRDRVWFATDGKGVGMKDASGFHHFEDGLNSKIVYSIAEDVNHQIWVNVPGDGLYRLDGNRFVIPAANKSIRDNNINCLTSDRFGNIVVMHDLGIDVYDVKKNKVRYLGEEVGIKDKIPNLNAVAKDGQGRIFFGTTLGIVVYASRTDPSSTTPRPWIAGIKIFGRAMNLGENSSFKYDQNDMTIGYNAFWYQNPANLSFQYRLERYDRDWVISHDHAATYPNLPPGDYIFRLRASDTEDFSGVQEATLNFSIRPPFWKTNWFYLLASIIVVVAGYSFVRYRERILLEDKRQLEERVRERTLEIQKKTDEIQAQNEEIQSQAEEIKGINEHLELLVKQRTEELVRKNNALEEYAFINAHALRGPLASILGLINLINKLELDEESQVLVRHLQSSAERLDTIVSSITAAIERGN